jgi:hypothetical protein
MTVSVAQAVRWSVNDEANRMRGEAVVACFEALSWHLRNETEDNHGKPWSAQTLPLQPTCCVKKITLILNLVLVNGIEIF